MSRLIVQMLLSVEALDGFWTSSGVFQVATASSSMPLKVSVALSAAEGAAAALEELLHSQGALSTRLQQVRSTMNQRKK